MTTRYRVAKRAGSVLFLMVTLSVTSGWLLADTGTCGGVIVNLPFTDVGGSVFFCQIAEAYFSGLTNGTSATTYSPSANVTREQMAAFVTRTQDQALKRGSRRAALDQFWNTTPHYDVGLGTVPNTGGFFVKSDGADVWASSGDTILRVRASDGKLLETWTGATAANGILIAMGRIFICGTRVPGTLYMIDPSQPAGAVTTVSTFLGDNPARIAFDGNRIWTCNFGTGPRTGTVSMITPQSGANWSGTTVGGFNALAGIVYDGANMWVTDEVAGTIDKLDSGGNIIQMVTLGSTPALPAFDGTNIWVPNVFSDSVSVVRASTGAVIATLTGNGLGHPFAAAFDGQRILVTNNGSGNLSLWKATDLTPIGSFQSGAAPLGVCSDGVYFWVQTQTNGAGLARF